MSDSSFDRYVQRISRTLTEEQELTYIKRIAVSRDDGEAIDALIAHRARYLLKAVSYLRTTIALCGVQQGDLFSLMYDSLLSMVGKFDPAISAKSFGTAWSASFRNDIMDYLRLHNHLVHMPRKQFGRHKKEGTFVRSQYPSIDAPEIATKVEGLLAAGRTVDSAEDSYLRILMRDRVARFVEEEMTAQQRLVFMEYIIHDQTGPKTIETLVEAGYPPCTDSNITQLWTALRRRMSLL